ncbi:Uncharacterised protein [Bordetella pertussis]|nr:Uncharacterised protein [Bordetella pertussis]
MGNGCAAGSSRNARCAPPSSGRWGSLSSPFSQNASNDGASRPLAASCSRVAA